ncbi:MAG: response regulator [Gammaproteobacteria bacterium]|nr:response regulator [Gammaproteobacteria bacterium]
MKIGISKQIIIISIVPALLVSVILSIHYAWDQYNNIAKSLSNNGELIAKQLSPAAEYTIYSGNTELIKPLVDAIIKNNDVLQIQILDNNNNKILNINKPVKTANKDSLFLKNLLIDEKTIKFIEPVFSAQISIHDDEKLTTTKNTNQKVQIGKVIVTLTNRYAAAKQTEKIKHSIIITILILLTATLIIIKICVSITRPIKSLTQAVRKITAGDLDSHIGLNSVGQLGILESCINQMKNELKESRTDLELQLDTYTDELQETLEELEIRNAELDITRSKAIYANNAKSEFLANMSHEIRTPLSGIIGFTELLQGTQLSGQQQDYANTIQKSSKSLLEIINDILDLAKIESGKTEITTSEFNLTDIIEDIINLLSPGALDKNIELLYSIDKNVPNIINADPFRIHQILTNLLGNAIKFTDDGYVYLQVIRGKINNVETSIKFIVSDTGIGMTKGDMKKLFNAFTQADTTITRRFGGTGLGLVISQKLTLLMKGEMNFDSTESDGSTFWFSIPVTSSPIKQDKSELTGKNIALFCNHFIAQQAFTTLFNNIPCTVNPYNCDNLGDLKKIEQENDIIIFFISRKEIGTEKTKLINELTFSKPSLLIASTGSHTKLRNLQQHVFDAAVFTSEKTEQIKKKLIHIINKEVIEAETNNTNHKTSEADWSNINVLVVDDNEVNLRLAEIILHKHKTRITTAASGKQAIKYAMMNAYDIIFMDLHMPGIDGYETTNKIRECSPGKQPVIIALTANALPQEKEKAMTSGMNGILIKPVSDAILQKVINQWILKEPIRSTIVNNIQHLQLDTVNANDATQSNIFSIELAKEFTGNNEKLAYELFDMLRAELTEHYECITRAIKSNDLSVLLEQVHKLHGASRCCGTTELRKASCHIESLINKNIKFDIEQETSPLLSAIQNVANYNLNIDAAQ